MMNSHHHNFLLVNKISLAELAEPLRRKVKTYNLLEAMRAETVDGEREELDRRIQLLDFEIVGDFLDEFFEPEEAPPSQAEILIEMLWKSGERSGLSPSFLESKGLIVSSKASVIKIGRFTLRRTGIFKINYKLERND